ncbi:uncharacterized protein LOC110977493 isoform X1 [Acanthaster planci]|uniref:Uncharacterized protein LOC110977493 isoform X1 n=1 Tax=Acanthaster planci TaxID=133434 RepID=A0A8B7Y6F8_ACAPL|nr:uncharacterized protein LOC110977493 isoform X1 [Acanthaster planci]
MASVWSIPNALTYICVLGVYHVSAQFCLKNSDGSRNCTVDNCDPPKLPPFPDLRKCINNTNLTETLSPCLPEVTTTEQPTSTFVETTAAETSSPDTGVFSTITGTITYMYSTGQGSPQGSPLTSEMESQSVVTIHTTATHPPISASMASSWPGSHTSEVASSTATSPGYTSSTTDVGNAIPVGENVTTPTTATPGAGLEVWLIVLIVFASLLGGLVILFVVYYVVKKKNDTCKVHCESEANDSSTDKGHHSTDQLDNSNPRTASGAQVILTPHAADPIESQDSRNRTFSAGSQAGDTSLLVGESAATGQSEPKSQKKKKKKSKDSKQLELGLIQNKEMAYDPAKTTEDV